MKGFLITLEGIDGSGKTTIIKELQKELGSNVITTQEPFSQLYAPEIRSLLNKNLSYDINETLINYFHCDRLIHMDWINKQLNMGKIVISDRFKLSSIIYHSVINLFYSNLKYTLSNLKNCMNRIKIINSDIPNEDICFFIDVNSNETKNRFKNSADKIDKNYDLQQKLYEAYKNVDYPYIPIKDNYSPQESVFQIIEKLNKDIL